MEFQLEHASVIKKSHVVEIESRLDEVQASGTVFVDEVEQLTFSQETIKSNTSATKTQFSCRYHTLRLFSASGVQVLVELLAALACVVPHSFSLYLAGVSEELSGRRRPY